MYYRHTHRQTLFKYRHVQSKYRYYKISTHILCYQQGSVIDVFAIVTGHQHSVATGWQKSSWNTSKELLEQCCNHMSSSSIKIDLLAYKWKHYYHKCSYANYTMQILTFSYLHPVEFYTYHCQWRISTLSLFEHWQTF